MFCWQNQNGYISTLLILILALLKATTALEDYELDLYDLVEEVNGTFYDFLGVEKDSETSDIRRAYRKLSLVLHPDKNKNDDAEEKFRQLAGIYEILRNAEKRERYNDILVNGLPTWRQPLYYYRKVRKFGFTESAIVLVIIVSIIHYAMIWAALWEKRYEIEEVFQGRLKKGTKRKNHQEYNDDLEEAMQREIDKLVRPNLSHLLVCRLTIFSIYMFINLPSNLRWTFSVLYERVNPQPIEDDMTDEDEVKESKKKVRCDEVFSNMSSPEMALDSKPVVYQESVLPAVANNEAHKPSGGSKKAHWTDTDYSKLARAMQKFPTGTQGRWEKIGQQLNHTPAEILSRAKQLKAQQFGSITPETTVLPEIKKKGMDYKPQGGISYRVEDTVDTPATADDRVAVAAAAAALPVSEWSQPQQKALENALASVPKTSADRWGDVANLVPDKNKAECMARYKYIATAIRQRKLNVNNTS